MVTRTIAIKVSHLSIILVNSLDKARDGDIYVIGVDDALAQHFLNAPHQFLMESAIYGVLDVMIQVLLEMAMLVMVMTVTMMHLASACIRS